MAKTVHFDSKFRLMVQYLIQKKKHIRTEYYLFWSLLYIFLVCQQITGLLCNVHSSRKFQVSVLD